MDFPLHQRAQRIIHHAMSFHCASAGEQKRYDGHLKMATTTPGANVPSMEIALVKDVQCDRIKRSKSLPHQVYRCHLGGTCLKAFTTTFA